MKRVSTRSLQFEDGRVSWCPSMDLIGVISAQEKVIEVFRCGTKIQQLFRRENVSAPTSFGFAEHGKLCVIGQRDGRIDVIKTDSGVEVFQYMTESSPI